MAKEKFNGKTETVAEYLARGGVITKIPEGQRQVKHAQRRPQAGGPAVLLTMDEHDLYHGEAKAPKTSSKKGPKVDFNALPEALKKKYLKELNREEDTCEDEV